MKYFFGCTFMSKDELEKMGVKNPIKLEYYKTQTNEEDVKNQNEIKYGVEVIKTTYIDEKASIERKIIPEIMSDEKMVDKILDKFRRNKVTPISAEYIIEDLLKETC